MAFISWIEKDGELYYITDEEYKSPEWKKRMTGLKDSDPIGHGAIHRFYDFSGGKSYTKREFWEPNTPLPLELSKLLCAENFDNNFKLLFPLSNTSDLVQMAVLGPHWLAQKALQEVFKRELNSEILCYLFTNSPHIKQVIRLEKFQTNPITNKLERVI